MQKEGTPGNVAMRKRTEEDTTHDTDLVKEVGGQMCLVLKECKGDRAQEEAMKAFGAVFTVEHKV